MAGHSKWANIKHKKAKEDAKKGKVFTKLIREITVAARIGGGDKNSNPRLRAAVSAAFYSNMTKDTVERAIKKGAGDDDGSVVDELVYEGYGPDGVAIIVECMTDNRNRTVAEVRHAFSKSGGNLGTSGSVIYLFQKKGIISFNEKIDEDELTKAAIDLNAEDIIVNEDKSIDVITAPNDFFNIKESLLDMGFTPESSEISLESDIKVNADLDLATKIINLIDKLEDIDDVQNVYTNADISDEVISQLES